MRRDLVCAAIGLALAGAYWAAASRLPTSFLSDAVGADGVPKALAALLAVLSLAIGARALFRRAESPVKKNHLRALGIALLGFVYVALAPYLGYLICVALLAGAARCTTPPRRRRWRSRSGHRGRLWSRSVRCSASRGPDNDL